MKGMTVKTRSTLMKLATMAVCVPAFLSVATMTAEAASNDTSSQKLSSADKQSISEFLLENGASQATATRIIVNLEHGILPDSDKDVGPLKTKTVTDGGMTKDVFTYPDGSISVTEVSSPGTSSGGTGTGVGTLSVTGCQNTGPHAYKNCYAQASSPLITLSFRFNFGPDSTHPVRITKVWDGAYTTKIASLSDARFVYKSATVEEYGGTECALGLVCEPVWIKVEVTVDHATGEFSNS